MIDFEEALKIAKSHKRDINHCVEYTNAYMFCYQRDDVAGAVESPIVVLKEDGRVMSMTKYAWTPGKEYVGVVEVPGL